MTVVLSEGLHYSERCWCWGSEIVLLSLLRLDFFFPPVNWFTPPGGASAVTWYWEHSSFTSDLKEKRLLAVMIKAS